MMDAVPLVRRLRGVSLAAVALALAVPSVPAQSQDTLAEKRLRKMEAEIRALQRKVFPGGDDRFFEPEITAQGASATANGQPATSAVTDLLTRMDALETQMTGLTAQIEQNTNRIAQLETGGAPAQATVAAGEGETAEVASAAPSSPAPQANLDAMTGGASAVAKPAATAAPAAPPSSERVRAVSAIVKPQTEDAADDEYTYGFRLWDAKFYPEAQQQLKIFLERYPKHWRTTWGRNLLGRVYLDDGNPEEAGKWFFENYQSDQYGARGPDSLLYLAVARKRLNDHKRACIALSLFSENHAAEAAGRLKSDYDATLNGLDCRE